MLRNPNLNSCCHLILLNPKWLILMDDIRVKIKNWNQSKMKNDSKDIPVRDCADEDELR